MPSIGDCQMASTFLMALPVLGCSSRPCAKGVCYWILESRVGSAATCGRGRGMTPREVYSTVRRDARLTTWLMSSGVHSWRQLSGSIPRMAAED